VGTGFIRFEVPVEFSALARREKIVGEMKTSKPFFLAAWKMRSMFSTVLFSLTLLPTAPHPSTFSLKTSFCGR